MLFHHLKYFVHCVIRGKDIYMIFSLILYMVWKLVKNEEELKLYLSLSQLFLTIRIRHFLHLA